MLLSGLGSLQGVCSVLFLRRSIFGMRYLYLSYSHITSVSNGWHGGSIWWCSLEWVLYWFHSHSSLFLGMVIRWFPLFVNISALSCMICIVGSVVFMSESGLHSFRCIWTNGSCSGSSINLVSLDCIWWKFCSIMSS
jgi:hypothetical protein